MGILFFIVPILYIAFIIFRGKAQKERRQELQEMYPEIKKKWEEKQIENFGEAIGVYPSKHLVERDKEWFKMIDKQREYAGKKNDLYAKQLQKEYNLTGEEWDKLDAQIFIEDAKELQNNPEFQKVLDNKK